MLNTLAIGARLLLYVGALIAIGEVFAARVRGGGWRTRAVTEWTSRLLLSWLAVLLALSVLLITQFLALELAPTREDLALLTRQTAWGRAWLWLAGVALLGTVAGALRAPSWVRMTVAVSLAVAMGGLGHAAADETAPVLSRALDAVHVVGMGAWIGTLLCLGALDLAQWARFSALATIAAPATVLSGVGSAIRRVGEATFPQIVASDYGRLLAAKTLVVLIVLGIGYWHRRAVKHAGAPSLASVRVELLLAFLVLVVTAVLTGTAPPGE